MRRIIHLGLAVAALCLVSPAASLATPGGGHGGGGGKKVHNVGYVFKGTVVSVTAATDYAPASVVVHVVKVNRHGRTLRGTDVTFLITPSTVIHKRGKHAPGALEDLVAGDRVQVKSKAPKRLAADYQFTARWINDKTRAVVTTA